MSESCYLDLGDREPTLLIPTENFGDVRAAMAVPDEAQWYPGAQRLPIQANVGAALAASRGLVLHVQEGRNSLYGWFNQASTRASSHWWISEAGRVEQYVPAGRRAWAQGTGNELWHSVETAGYAGEPLTAAQIAALALLFRWGMEHWGWPAQIAETPAGYGLGWHGMGAPAWGHSACPGPTRRAQRVEVIARAQDAGPTTEVDMALDPEDIKALTAAVSERLLAELGRQLNYAVTDNGSLRLADIRHGSGGEALGLGVLFSLRAWEGTMRVERALQAAPPRPPGEPPTEAEVLAAIRGGTLGPAACVRVASHAAAWAAEQLAPPPPATGEPPG